MEDSPVCRLLSKMPRLPLVFSGRGSYRSITSAAEIVEVWDGGDLSSSCAFTSCSRALASQRLNHQLVFVGTVVIFDTSIHV